VYVDLRKAFDSIDHVKLLYKLQKHFNIPCRLLVVIGNYLINRYYFIRIGSFLSKGLIVNRGIGQGLVFGPNLFIYYINDLYTVLSNCYYTLFADDLAIYISGRDVNVLTTEMNEIMCSVDNWFNNNGLSINYQKTKYMYIRKPTTKVVYDPGISFNGNTIERVSVFKYLGIHVDDKFNFGSHFDSVSQRVNVNCGMIRKFRRLLPTRAFIILLNVMM